MRPGTPADVVMEHLAADLGRLGEVEPPVDMRLLASIQNISEIEQALSSHSGCLIANQGRLRIELSAADSYERQQFTIGHEICHTLLPGFTLERNFRCTPGVATRTPTAELNVEWLADVGASELLLPRRFVASDFAKHPLGWPMIERVATKYGASLEATARRWVRLQPNEAFFASLAFAPSRANRTPELRVQRSSTSPGLNVFIPKNKSLPRDHPVFNATVGEDVDTIAEMRSLRAPGLFRVVARHYPYNNHEGESVMRVMLLGHGIANDPKGRE